MSTKFYFCPTCGNLIVKVEDSGITPVCCGKEMVELQPRTVDTLAEKHVPVFKRLDDCTVKVEVGSVPHPMLKEHHIRFVWLETIHGGQLRRLAMDGADGTQPRDPAAGDILAPEACATFCTCSDPVVAVYAYCNLHGFWKLSVNEPLSPCTRDTPAGGPDAADCLDAGGRCKPKHCCSPRKSQKR